MKEELQKEIFDKISLGISALAEKLQVSGEFIFDAAVRWHMASALGMLIFLVVYIFVYKYGVTKLWELKKEEGDKWDSDDHFLIWLATTLGLTPIFILGGIFCFESIPTLIAPEYAVIKGLLELVK